MKKILKNSTILCLVLAMVLSICPNVALAGSKDGKVTLSSKSVKVKKGKSKTVKLKVGKKCKLLKVKVKKVDNKKIAKVKAKGSKIVITGKKAGTTKAKISVKYKVNKKTCSKNYQLKIKVTNSKTAVASNSAANPVIQYGNVPANPVIPNIPNPSAIPNPTASSEAEKKHSVVFEANGGSAVETVYVKDGESFEAPAMPTKDGYTFSAWYSDKSLLNVYDFGERVRGDLVLYAGWNDNSIQKNYTRSEWISILTKEVGISLDGIDEEQIEYDYADISGEDNALSIEAAHKYGFLPDEVADKMQDVPHFYPKETLTREYMAYTLSKALGFEKTEKEIECDDLDDCKYPNEVTNVVSADIMRLDDGDFSPKGKATYSDVELSKTMIGFWKDSENISEEDYRDNTVLADGTSDLSQITDYETSEDGDIITLTINQEGVSLEEGKTVILGKNKEHNDVYALKVTKKISDNTYSCVKPEIGEVYSDIDVVEEGVIDYKNAKAADDDISLECTVDEDAAQEQSVGGTLNPDVKLTFDMGSGKKITDSLKLKGKVVVTFPEIKAILDADVGLFSGISINELTLSLTEKMEVSGGLYWTVAESGQSLQDGNFENAINSIFSKASGSSFEGGRLELGEVPFQIAYGFGVKVKLFAEISLKGEVSIKYAITGTEGLQYKNDSFRWIHNFTDELSLFEISGSGYLQIGIALDATFLEIFDIVGVTFQIGPAFNVKLQPHVIATDTLVCANASLYLGAKFTLDKQTLIGELLDKVMHLTVEKEVLKDDSNNPLRLNFHMENFRRVEKCTFGMGTIKGTIVDSKDSTPIKNAKVQVYMPDSEDGDLLIRTCYTDENGEYSVDNLCDGTYKLIFTANTYKECEITEFTVIKNAVNTVDTVYMTERVNTTGSLEINVLSATSGEQLSGWSYKIESLNGAYDVEPVQGTASTSKAAETLPVGNYHIAISLDNYITAYASASVQEDITTVSTIAISPTMSNIFGDGAIRFVLTWGEEPRDLDSHLFIKNSEDKVLSHVFYSNKNYESEEEDGLRNVNLDVDDTSSYGPETITIENPDEDNYYSYYVYDYSNEYSSNSDAMSKSTAKVAVYTGSDLKYTFNVPYGVSATAWKLFDYDPKTGTIKIYNEMGFSTNRKEFGETIKWVNDTPQED